MGTCVIIRGALGAGKTTIAHALAEAIEGRVVSIDAILDRHGLEEWESGYISERSFLRVNDFAIEEALPYLRVGRSVIFDGNFYYRRAIEDLLDRLPYPHQVFTLKVPVDECRERDRRRAVPLGDEAVQEVFAKVAEVDCGIDVDGCRPVPEIVAELVRRLPSPSPSRITSSG